MVIKYKKLLLVFILSNFVIIPTAFSINKINVSMSDNNSIQNSIQNYKNLNTVQISEKNLNFSDFNNDINFIFADSYDANFNYFSLDKNSNYLGITLLQNHYSGRKKVEVTINPNFLWTDEGSSLNTNNKIFINYNFYDNNNFELNSGTYISFENTVNGKFAKNHPGMVAAGESARMKTWFGFPDNGPGFLSIETNREISKSLYDSYLNKPNYKMAYSRLDAETVSSNNNIPAYYGPDGGGMDYAWGKNLPDWFQQTIENDIVTEKTNWTFAMRDDGIYNFYGGTTKKEIIITDEDKIDKNMYPSEFVKSDFLNDKININFIKNGFPGSIKYSKAEIIPYDQEGKVEIKFIPQYDLSIGKVIKGEPISYFIDGFICGDTQTIANFIIPKFYPESNQYPSELSNASILNFIYDKLLTTNLPHDITRSQIYFKIIETDNILGELKIQIFVKKYWKDNQLITSIDPYYIGDSTIFANKKPGPTFLNDYILSDSFPETKKTTNEISDNELIDFIFLNKNIIYNLPNDFSINNIFIYERFDDPLTGEINLKIKLNNYFDDKGILSNDDKIFPVIKLSNFKIQLKTIFKDKIILNNHQSIDKLNDNDILKIINSDGIFNKPNNFLISKNLKVIEIKKNFINGNIDAKYSINNYFNNLGLLDTSEKINIINISGFNKVNPTSINEVINSQANNLLASEYFNSKIEVLNLLNDNIENKPKDFSINNIDYKIIEINDKEGFAKIELILNKYIDSKGTVINIEKKWFIKINNFKNNLQTIIKDEIYIKNINIPSEVDNNSLKQIIYQNAIINVPPNFSSKNIFISDISYFNLIGKISVIISLDLFNDQNGDVNYQSPISKKINIYGFRTTSKTIVPNSVYINDANLQNSYNYSNQKLISNLIKNIEFLPDNFDIENISITNRTNSNNLGSISVIISLTQYYDELGEVKIEPMNPLIKEVKFYGLQPVKNTVVLEEINLINFNDRLPTSLSKKEIEKLVIELGIKNLPNEFNFETDISISKIFYDNLNGVIDFEIKLLKYFDYYGNYIDNKDLITNCQLTSLFRANETIIANIIEVKADKVLVQDITNSDIKNIIISNTLNAPNNYDFNKMIIINKIQLESINGLIKLNITAENIYDSNGEIFSKDLDLIIKGFKKTNKTNFINLPNIDGSKINETPIDVISNIDVISKIKEMLVAQTIRLYRASGLALEEEDVNIQISDVNNIFGTVQFSVLLKKYYDENGILINSINYKKFTSAVLLNLIKINPTTINSTVSIRNIITKNPSDYSDIFSSASSNANKKTTTYWMNRFQKNPNILKEFIIQRMIQGTSLNLQEKDLTIELTEELYTGIINARVTIPKYYNKEGILESSDYRHDIVIYGFYSIFDIDFNYKRLDSVPLIASLVSKEQILFKMSSPETPIIFYQSFSTILKKILLKPNDWTGQLEVFLVTKNKSLLISEFNYFIPINTIVLVIVLALLISIALFLFIKKHLFSKW